MPAIITPGELAVGQHITVYRVKEIENPFGPVPAHHSSPFCGAVLEVKALALPYVLITDITGGPGFGNVIAKLDTRDLELMELSEEYVETYTAKGATYEVYTALLSSTKKDDLGYLACAIEYRINRVNQDFGGFVMAKMNEAWLAKYGNKACWTENSDSTSREWYYATSAGYTPVFVSYWLRRVISNSTVILAADELMPDLQKRLAPVPAKAIEADRLATLKRALRITRRLRPDGCKVEVVAPKHAEDKLNAGGLACMDSNKVLLLESYALSASLEDLVRCLVEEYMHLRSGAGDLSEQFQRALVSQIATMLTPKTRVRRAEAVLSL